jgi:hypothetical protein
MLVGLGEADQAGAGAGGVAGILAAAAGFRLSRELHDFMILPPTGAVHYWRL